MLLNTYVKPQTCTYWEESGGRAWYYSRRCSSYEAVMAADYKSTPKRVLGAIGYITVGFIASLLLYRILERQKMIQNYYSSLSDDIDDI